MHLLRRLAIFFSAFPRVCLSSRVRGVIFPLLVLSFFCGCTRHRDPQAALDHAVQTLRHGDIDGARREADRGYKDFHGLSTDWAWKFAILRARVFYWQGMNEDALKLLQSEPQPPCCGDLAVQRHRLEGVAFAALRRFKEADSALSEAHRLCNASEFPACADLNSTEGHLEMERGHYAQAHVLFERVLAAARARNDGFMQASALLDLSWSANEQTHFDEALDAAEGARQISLPLGFPDIAQTSLGNMGWAKYKLGDVKNAEKMLGDAKQEASKLGDLTNTLRWLTVLGYIYMDTARLPLAEQSFDESLKLARNLQSRGDIVNSLIALSFVDEQTGKLADAKRNAEEALAMSVADGNKRDQVYPRLVLGRIAAQQHDIAAAGSSFHEVAQSPDAPVFLQWQAEHSLARLYEDENQPEAADREYKNAISIFESARKDLTKLDSRLPFLANATSIYDDYVHFLIVCGKPNEALQWADFNRARTLSEGLGLLQQGSSFKLDPLPATQTARRVGGTILFYWLGEKQSYLWAITPQKTTLFNLPAKVEIENAVRHYRDDITGPADSSGATASDGAALYAMLVAPARALLPAKNTSVFIVADGVLNNLNFETLPVPDPQQHYWIEDVTISNGSSLRLLQATARQQKVQSSARLLIFGDAVAASTDYPPLPKAAVEMQQVESHFSQNALKIFAREQATPHTYLTSNPEQFSYVHFVTHGIASSLSPLDSAIVLSRDSTDTDSFKLYARDIMRQHLRAELVTVSACYGSGMPAYSGEGLVGLSWAFLHAGAHNVIGALWEVSDESTPQLMNDLYANLKLGQTPAVALRSAKLSLLHSQSAFHKPFYWAPFQLYTGS